jgi:hypothetical protein
MNCSKGVAVIKAKDVIKIKPEYQDEGDDLLVWIALEDEDGGRVRIAPLNTGLKFPPNQVVRTEMIDKAGQSN